MPSDLTQAAYIPYPVFPSRLSGDFGPCLLPGVFVTRANVPVEYSIDDSARRFVEMQLPLYLHVEVILSSGARIRRDRFCEAAAPSARPCGHAISFSSSSIYCAFRKRKVLRFCCLSHETERVPDVTMPA